MIYRQGDPDHDSDFRKLSRILASNNPDHADKPTPMRQTCETCSGEGRVARDRYEPHRLDIFCWRCNGTGKTNR